MKNQIIEYSKKIGIDAIGFTKPMVPVHHIKAMKKYKENNLYGTMEWLINKLDIKTSPHRILENAKTVIMIGVNYYYPIQHKEFKMATYSQTREDYHKWLKKIAKELVLFIQKIQKTKYKIFVDTAPIMEKALTAQTAIGWQGKNSCIISKNFGPWLILGTIILDIEIPEDHPTKNMCGICKKCINNCPTSAIISPYVVDSNKCISYLTIEYKGEINPKLENKIQDNIFGCDICLLACPWNRFAKQSFNKETKQDNLLQKLTLSTILKMNENTFLKIFKNKPMERTGYESFLRNAIIVAGNSFNKAYLPLLKNLLKNNISHIINTTCQRAIKKIEEQC